MILLSCVNIHITVLICPGREPGAAAGAGPGAEAARARATRRAAERARLAQDRVQQQGHQPRKLHGQVLAVD